MPVLELRENVQRCFQAPGVFYELGQVGDFLVTQFNPVLFQQLLDFHELQVFQPAFDFVIHSTIYRRGLLADWNSRRPFRIRKPVSSGKLSYRNRSAPSGQASRADNEDMPHTQRIDEIRRQVSETFARMAIREPGQFRESILIRNGSYCGRRFEADGAYAIWFLEEDEVKFYRALASPASVPLPLTELTRMAA